MTPVVPFLDLAAPYEELRAEIDGAVGRVLGSGWYLLGTELRLFEEEFARYCGARYCVGVANGLDALRLALLARGIGPGDEVLVPSHTFIATWLAVSQTGATPVPVEPNAETFTLDADRLDAALTERTRAVIPVHLYGQPADMDAVQELARLHDLFVLEDAAQAHGARFQGRRAGALGDAAAWSFYPGKNLGAMGDGGAVTTDDHALAERVRMLRNYGSSVRYHNELQGYNSRLDDLQAAVLRVKLAHLDEWNARRAAAAGRYRVGLAESRLDLPLVAAYAEPVWHLFVVRSTERDVLQRALRADGIETLIHYPVPPHRQPAYRSLGLSVDACPIANRLASEVLSLPIGPHLDEESQQRVIAALLRHTTRALALG